ncbi:MAG TPA: efflux RND transporter periplasmic adaptor subunit [Ideonella sp.]|uniref:efflux RND transporter periplasmic adaptor subunit n=1 Tax=Ideonella sp. TaxID=1929293 RepID=UPI002E344E5B|nr:efflux RND transporter periplasmic adaptor subunit [Ideonella sp.]HEX5686009.1 efflux RND transporter periplasmic adaptor subunit [Ideonella sp.]
MTRKLWISAALGTAGLAAIFIWAFRPQPVPVETAEVRRSLFEQTIDEDGKTRVRERYVVSAPVAGRLARVRVKAGDLVQAGSAVAELSPGAPAMLDGRTARELSERVGAAEAALAQARARVARAEAALDQAKTDVARQKRLQDDGFVAPAALDQAQLAARVQDRDLEATRFAEIGAAHDLAQARAALMRAREGAGAHRPGTTWPIESPVDGQALRVLQESETVVGVGTPLLEIGDPTQLEIVIDVLSSDGRRIAPGARVDVDAGPGPRLAGRVRRVEPAAFTKVSALGVEEQRVNVIVDIASPSEQWRGLGDQFRIDARIVIFEHANAITMPVAALFRDGNQWAVYAVHDGRAAKQHVKVGGRAASDAWIEDGVAPGARVVVYPSDSVADGVRVKVVRGPQ